MGQSNPILNDEIKSPLFFCVHEYKQILSNATTTSRSKMFKKLKKIYIQSHPSGFDTK